MGYYLCCDDSNICKHKNVVKLEYLSSDYEWYINKNLHPAIQKWIENNKDECKYVKTLYNREVADLVGIKLETPMKVRKFYQGVKEEEIEEWSDSTDLFDYKLYKSDPNYTCKCVKWEGHVYYMYKQN
jgi:hypothetical protein